jgi:hypothetical protein
MGLTQFSIVSGNLIHEYHVVAECVPGELADETMVLVTAFLSCVDIKSGKSEAPASPKRHEKLRARPSCLGRPSGVSVLDVMLRRCLVVSCVLIRGRTYLYMDSNARAQEIGVFHHNAVSARQTGCV